MSLQTDSLLWQHFNNLVEMGMAECKLCKQLLKNNRSFNLKQHLAKVHRDNSELWKYYDNNIADGVAVCKTCKKSMQSRTCNMRLHLRRAHDINVQPGVIVRPFTPNNENQIQTVPNRKAESRMRKKSIFLVKMDRHTLIRSVLGFIVEDRLSLSAIDSKHMQSLFQPFCKAISILECKKFQIKKEELESLLGTVANFTRNEFLNELNWRLLSLTIETDINASPSSFCLSVMFVDKSQIQKRVLGIIDLDDSTELTADHIKGVLHKFNIDSKQIITAYWDSTKKNYRKSVSNAEYLKEIENFEKYPDLQLGDITVKPFFGVIAHQCILDVLKNRQIFQQFLECRNLVKFVNDYTNGYYGLFEKNSLTIPQLDSPWIWGSTYQMMQNLQDARSILEDIKYEKPDNPNDCFETNDKLWSFIEAFCRVLQIVQKSILKFYGQEINCGDLYAQWLKCKVITEKLLSSETKNDSFSYMILTELTKCIENRSQEVLSQDCFVACLYIDPRFQHTLNLSQKSIALEYLKKLWNLARLYNFEIDSTESEMQGDTTTNTPMDEDENNFLNEYLSQDIDIKDTKTADVYRKIDELKLSFQTVETNVLTFWKSQQNLMPEIHALSSICFAIPATQHYCKNIYGDFYNLDCDADLNSFTQKNILFMRLNSEHLTKAVESLNDISSESESDDDDDDNDDDDDDDDPVLVYDSNSASTSTAIL